MSDSVLTLSLACELDLGDGLFSKPYKVGLGKRLDWSDGKHSLPEQGVVVWCTVGSKGIGGVGASAWKQDTLTDLLQRLNGSFFILFTTYKLNFRVLNTQLAWTFV